jgi:CAP12/Pycsar effector protein, TIR domain
VAESLTRPRAVLEELFRRTMTSGQRTNDSIITVGAEAERDAALEKLVQWDRNARTLLAGAFTGPDPAAAYPNDIDVTYLTGSRTFEGDLERIKRAFDTRQEALQSITDMLGLYNEPSEDIRVGREHPASRSSTTVFIVHGHSEGPKQQVARFLETGTNSVPIILHEQAKRGRAIIETLEEYAATAAFAIVLLTADDYGGLAGSHQDQPRARQNVVFELGFFIGALGRSRVAVLYEEGVELPSDMNGILYTILDAQGAWKLSLGRELRAASFAVDLNVAR